MVLEGSDLGLHCLLGTVCRKNLRSFGHYCHRIQFYYKDVPVTVTVTLCHSPSDTLLDSIFSVLVLPYWLTTKCSRPSTT